MDEIENKKISLRDISFKICNNSESIELMWIGETLAASIFIDDENITLDASRGEKNIVKEFDRDTNLFDVRVYLEKFLNKEKE